jgi:hypothetical protein
MRVRSARCCSTVLLASMLGLLAACGPSNTANPNQPTMNLGANGQQPLVGSFGQGPSQMPYAPPADKTAVAVDGGVAIDGTVDPAGAAPVASDGNSLTFRDTFDGSSLDERRWVSVPQSGVINVANGVLELLNTRGTRNFPYVVTKNPIMPPEGAFYVEWSYKVLVPGSTGTTFGLDAAPPVAVGDAVPVAPAFMTSWFYADMAASVEGQGIGLAKLGYAPAGFHRVRVEVDANNSCRLIFDGGQVGQAVTIKKRPTRFYIGSDHLLTDVAPTSWPRLQLKYLESGPLTTADPATPPPPPTPGPTAAPATPKPSATAGSTPRPTAQPTAQATPAPTATATPAPTATATPAPTATPTPAPTATPTPAPTATPTPAPTATPTPAPTATPTPTPT